MSPPDPATSTVPPPPRRRAAEGALGFSRAGEDRVVAGIAAGLAHRIGVDPVLVRIAFILFAFAGGAGVLLYLLGWALSSDEDPGADAHDVPRAPDLQQGVALGLVTLGVLLLLREAGFWLGDGLVWPVVIGGLGSAVIWTRGDAEDRARWSRMASHIPGDPVGSVFGGRISIPRILVGATLIGAGMAGFLAANDALVSFRPVVLAVTVTVAGIALVFGPWLARLVAQLSEERRERIRSEERADVAAHLHDSVLQTLALIQRSSEEPRRMVALARRQERELRAWLYGRGAGPDTRTVRAALDAMTEEVEVDHEVDLDVVLVGDGVLDDDTVAVIGAVREAAVNAAKHAGVDVVSVYLESTPEVVTAFVRDRGRGFDPAAVPADRRGIADSIRGRVERRGGTVELWTEPGGGTEVAVTLPRHPASRSETTP
ncbi:MAG: PspC domain-containing protein [Actinobacteria bacterium]|nr:PspC domain-containing protein [Actinomycetota bacterium]